MADEPKGILNETNCHIQFEETSVVDAYAGIERCLDAGWAAQGNEKTDYLPDLTEVVGPKAAESISEYFVPTRARMELEDIVNSTQNQERMCRAFEQAYGLLENSITSVEMIGGELVGKGEMEIKNPRRHGKVVPE